MSCVESGCGSRSRACVVAVVRIGAVLVVLGHGAVALAQSPQQVCLPGTPLCVSSDGRGGVQVNANGNGQVGPNGVNAGGQVGANGNSGANANAGVPQAPTLPGYYRGSIERFGVGVTLCPVAREGVWSGFKAGGCAAVSFRFETLTFEMETQLLYGGTTHAFDWSFPMSFIIPLANEKSLFDGPYLRFGGSPIGATFAHDKDGGGFVRFGLFAGGGYEYAISDALSWRIVDARLSLDAGTRKAVDDKGHWLDPGLQLSTALVL